MPVKRTRHMNLSVAIREMDGLRMRVGWFAAAKYDDDTPVAAVAAQNEFGNPAKSIPPRPFMRPTIAEKQSEWIKKIGQGASAIANGRTTAGNVMESMGLLVSGEIRETITKIHSPPLSEKTIAARLAVRADKSTIGALDKPLVFEGIMLNSLTYVTYQMQPDLFK